MIEPFRGVSEGRVTIKQSGRVARGNILLHLRYKDMRFTSFEKAGYLLINDNT
jgi:hypothetical protein